MYGLYVCINLWCINDYKSDVESKSKKLHQQIQ